MQKSIALPEVRSGYGFAIGNVAAFDMDDYMKSLGAIEFGTQTIVFRMPLPIAFEEQPTGTPADTPGPQNRYDAGHMIHRIGQMYNFDSFFVRPEPTEVEPTEELRSEHWS